MTRRSWWSLALAFVVATPLGAQAAPAHVPPPPKLDYDSLAFGRQLTQWFLYGELDSLWAHSDSTLIQNIGGDRGFWSDQIAQFALQLGQETALVEERWVQRLGKRQYWRMIRLTDAPEPYALRWVLSPGKKVSGLGINPMSALPPVDP